MNSSPANKIFKISNTERFWLLARYPWLGRPRDEDLHPGLRSIQARPCVSIRTESGLTPEPRPSGSGQTREKSACGHYFPWPRT